MIAEESPPVNSAATPDEKSGARNTEATDDKNCCDNLHQDEPICQQLEADGLPKIIPIAELRTKHIPPPTEQELEKELEDFYDIVGSYAEANSADVLHEWMAEVRKVWDWEWMEYVEAKVLRKILIWWVHRSTLSDRPWYITLDAGFLRRSDTPDQLKELYAVLSENIRQEFDDWREGKIEGDGDCLRSLRLGLPRKNESTEDNKSDAKSAPQEDTNFDTHEYHRVDAVDFPKPARAEAFYGIAGEITEEICGGSELKPEVVLAQFLCIFGNMLGRSPFKVQEGRHGTLINVAIVGDSSDGAKGGSLQAVKALIQATDQIYWLDNLSGGYNSSEALLEEITDEVSQIRKNEKVLILEGVLDKRLVVIEEEFSRLLQVGRRDGSTMSEILRQFYDLPDKLRAPSRKSRLVSTKPFVSILGHITPEQLRISMPTVEAFNGFANRFIFAASQRTASIPEPPAINWSEGAPAGIVSRLQDTIKIFRPYPHDCARNDDREFRFSRDARDEWARVYHGISQQSARKSGLRGAIIARAKPAILRLAMIYTALDRKTLIEPQHLAAAVALWDYAAHSAAWAFGTASGSVNGDKILKFLRRQAKKGAPRSLIYKEVFGGHKPSAEITEELSQLNLHGLAVLKRVEKSDLWFAVEFAP